MKNLVTQEAANLEKILKVDTVSWWHNHSGIKIGHEFAAVRVRKCK